MLGVLMGKKRNKFDKSPLVNPNYNEQLLALKTRFEIKNYPNLEFVIKKLPDSDQTGRLDNRVFGALQIKKDPTPLIHSLDAILRMKHFNPVLAVYRRMVGTTQNHDISRGSVTMQNMQLDTDFGLMNIRLFIPMNKFTTQEKLPVILYLHGGGFIGTTFKTILNTCRGISYKTGAIVVAFEYSLAPEKKFPAALRDTIAMLDWVYEKIDDFNGDADNISIMGDSSGANIAAAMVIYDIENGKKIIKQQILLYPIINMSQVETDEYKWSIDNYEITDHEEVVNFVVRSLGIGVNYIKKIYAGDANLFDPLISPLFVVDDTARQMPPTMIITGEYDFLRIESEVFAKKLARQGVNTTLFRYRGLDHGFVDKIGYFPQSEDVIDEIAWRFKERIIK